MTRPMGLAICLWLVGACGQPTPSSQDAIVVILPRAPQQLDPRHVGDAYGLKISRLLHASLFTIDPRDLSVVGDLALRYEMPGPTTYRVHLRPGLRFSDGTPLGPADVVATFRGLVDPAVASRYARSYGRIESVRQVGPSIVEFELAAPHATFITDLEIPILRADQAGSPAGGPSGGLVGAGPYVLGARSSGRLELRANRHYHRGEPRHPRLDLLVVRDDNTRALRIQAGAADLALNAIPALLVPMFEDNPRYRVTSVAGVGTTYLGLNLEAPALGDLRVRRALAHAVDRATLVQTKLGARARLASGWVPPGHWAYASDTPAYGYDRAAAERLLDEAGFPRGTDGVRLRLSLRTGADRAVQSMARALAAMFGDVGVDVDVRPSETATLLADLGKGRFQLAYMQVPEVFEPHVLSWFFASDRIPIEGKQEGSNRWRLRDAQLDAWLEEGRRTPVQQARRVAYRGVQHRLANQLPVIPLWHEDVVAVTSARLSNYDVPRDGRFGTLGF